ncbi:MAG: aldo/keto reductase [Halanaerobium sp. 4-GBenrich]|jgi:aryl-alcohol dehydrogenase-like predicted oxidoreductase|uniref:Aryl-alcohol dehydrogenase-like predicted oxidoreductase n=1 Tax=Halanaerobium congolense TaxID=54121 RepID=A0A318ED22_9FIRM|nr:aldo/keto reductase [Halanaerobium congolense]KXS50235.1 MAG: aldo/keto reductase [Halanaerobium sp. T82-1]ODS50142.1 MAG: aldo/keto reductase [Halanaerobium sp. 4-GBenrich]OEG63436.1 MAG: aldo/keto reductase [Halanaerobium sp. MDAL1]PUU89278.1 MAG: aldo/keto reductase [Halanaerobium sp.]PXV67614.1 aryl-alcohol dehydrogenase-like predicted oxidoreductase [Halanaerobium congolense]
MKYRHLGNSNLKISAVGLGTWAYGNDTFGEVDDQQSIKAVRAAVDSGINLIDTAPAYGDGHAEKVVGKAIQGIRDKVVIATKCGTHRDGPKYVRDLSPERIRTEIENSLKRLDIEQIDLYQIHWPDPDTPLEESVEELLKLKKEGKFKYLAVCNFGVELMQEISEMTDIISLQPQYSLLKRDIENKIIPYLLDNNLGTLSYGTLGGGILSGKYQERPQFDDEKDNRAGFYPFFKEENWEQTQSLITLLKEIAAENGQSPAQTAINWSINRPGITTALVGAKNEKQARENAEAADFSLTKTEMTELTKKSDEVIKNLKI